MSCARERKQWQEAKSEKISKEVEVTKEEDEDMNWDTASEDEE